MTMIQTLKSTGRAALIAIALGGTALAAMPAQAAEPTGGFTLQFGNGGYNGGYNDGYNGPHNGSGYGFGFGDDRARIQLRFGDDGYRDRRLTNSQVVRGLEWRGFDNVKIVKKLSNKKVVAIGKWGRSWYEMRVDTCTGKVDKVKKVKQRSNGAFSITLNF